MSYQVYEDKLSSRYIELYEILDKIDYVTHRLALPSTLVHNNLNIDAFFKIFM